MTISAVPGTIQQPQEDFLEIRPSPSIRGAHELRARIFLERSIEALFDFFSDAHNLQCITPRDLDFTILTPAPIEMCVGARIDYKLRVRRIPIRWQSIISIWEPPYRFVDEQVQGPYRIWRHEHRFEVAEGGTHVIDEVTFKPIGGALMTRLFVGRDVRRIFEFRSAALRERLATPLGS